MRIRKICYQDIIFDYCSYPKSMYDSVKRIGLSFPVKVNYVDGKYYCIDGNKRLSIIHDLLLNEEGYERRKDVPYIIYNDGSSRSNDCWRDRNMH